jgi:hypothetical protein
VATNEFEHAWMDEGFNTYSTARAIAQAYTPNYYSRRYFGNFVPWMFREFPLTRETEGDRLNGYRVAGKGDVPSTPTWQYFPGTAGAITYNKTALWLNTLERMLGWETMQRVMSTYFSRWAFRHPKPADFFSVANEVSGRDLTWFFDQVYRSSNVFDYGVDSFSSEPAGVRGYAGDGNDRRFVETGDGGPFHTTVVVRRFGEAIFPVDVRVMFENKEEMRWHWDGQARWKAFDIDRPARAATVQVDPEHILLLDVHYTNNSASLQPRARQAARKWSLVWLVWLQDHLLTYGFFV